MTAAAIVPAGAVLWAAVLVAGELRADSASAPRRLAAGVLGAVAAVSGTLLVREAIRPRLARRGDRLLVNLRLGRPLEVPLEEVECIFLGRAPAMPGSQAASASVVVRLAESAPQWHQRDVLPLWGAWRDGYITIRGTWCERLSLGRVGELNERLRLAKQQAHAGTPQ